MDTVGRTFEHRLRARYAETDAQAVVHHAAWLPWLEEARIAALRGCGFSYRELEASGLLLPVVELRLRFRAPARFDDEVLITTQVALLGRTRLRFDSLLSCAGRSLGQAEVTVAAIDRTGRPQRVDAGLLSGLSIALGL